MASLKHIFLLLHTTNVDGKPFFAAYSLVKLSKENLGVLEVF